MKISLKPQVCLVLLSLAALVTNAADTTRLAVSESGRVFIINAPVTDLNEFKKLVSQAKVLQAYGKVKVVVSTLADKSFHEIPAGGSSWHEYASANPTPFKFFPDKTIAPFVPAEFVKKNRQLLLDKTGILRQNGMEAAFLGYEPNFLPAAFFDANPSMLGPRVDHPRRSRQKAFAPCIHNEATQETYINMMAEMLKQAPEITAFGFKTNDAGAGICWGEWLYSGPNGPSACKNYSMGQTTKLLLETFQKGAAKAGRPLTIYLDEGASNFSDAERADIKANLPPNCYFGGDNQHRVEQMGGTISSLYPVTGIINPLSLLRRANSLRNSDNSTVFINLRAAYDRGAERLDMSEFLFNTIAAKLKGSNVSQGLAALQELNTWCEEWVGKQSAAKLYEAVTTLDEAMTYKQATFPRVHSLYWGVTMRLINRPLVIAPQRLSAEEEKYFLPHIFNTSIEEARMDYMDLHGGRFTITPGVVDHYVRRIHRAANLLESIEGNTPSAKLFKRMALSLRIHASIMRSCSNFAAAQTIRDRNKETLMGPGKRPEKEANWTGHPDFIPFNNIMRDELDNTNELIGYLEKGGMELLEYAADPKYEDHFNLGPQLINQLKQKRKIMLDHWQDVELYLASPLK